MSEQGENGRGLGRVEGKLDALMETVKQSNKRSDESRRRVIEQLEALRQDTATIRHDHEVLKTRVDKIEPAARQIMVWRQRGVGALAMVGVAATALGATIGAWWQKIAAFLLGG